MMIYHFLQTNSGKEIIIMAYTLLVCICIILFNNNRHTSVAYSNSRRSSRVFVGSSDSSAVEITSLQDNLCCLVVSS